MPDRCCFFKRVPSHFRWQCGLGGTRLAFLRTCRLACFAILQLLPPRLNWCLRSTQSLRLSRANTASAKAASASRSSTSRSKRLPLWLNRMSSTLTSPSEFPREVTTLARAGLVPPWPRELHNQLPEKGAFQQRRPPRALATAGTHPRGIPGRRRCTHGEPRPSQQQAPRWNFHSFQRFRVPAITCP